MIKLSPLTEAEFEKFSQRSVSDYAENMTKCSTLTMSTALSKAGQIFRRYLPHGPDTPNHHLLSIRPIYATHAVGDIWLQVKKKDKSAFLFDIYIYPDYRGLGYAKSALLAVEGYVRTLGVSTIRLHVFGHNHAARSLYGKLGYADSHVTMMKDL
ncbi:GNAT family N-acetyltransferase [Cupriavidus consociatus]|uniref:GNAT family N-acetyltransferase n=1 Tax=Cupriavidus consociatus TaxID=2821357 RepID=UPI001AEA946D|nr:MULTISPECIES: GNAT family N-acetyltransferase [unclassified Cupriavidus]MBP0619150.1 GNAT family N-acetyltransferase [Cupriavidus sp. LEh25]MDK2655795.1 GNAT family N-acetyltransferase [Cupriavidus sp. LEh21]